MPRFGVQMRLADRSVDFGDSQVHYAVHDVARVRLVRDLLGLAPDSRPDAYAAHAGLVTLNTYTRSLVTWAGRGMDRAQVERRLRFAELQVKEAAALVMRFIEGMAKMQADAELLFREEFRE